MRSALYTGTLVHVRREPSRHVFRNRLCFYLLDLDELPALHRNLKLFSYNRSNVVSMNDADHLGDPDRSISENVSAFLARHDLEIPGGRILLLTNLRVLGYVFNPVSFFYCYSASGELTCVVAEVHNTFGERWPYLLRPGDGDARHAMSSETAKRLHVSPFFGLDQRYRFALSEPGEEVYARIDVEQDGVRMFGSVLAGRRHELTSRSLATAQLRYPLMPTRVAGSIHWQALRLYLRGLTFHPKPAPSPDTESSRHAIPLLHRLRWW